MNYFNDVVYSIMFLLFPIMFYLFYIAYTNSTSQDENKLFLYFSLFSSVYLILDKNVITFVRIALCMANIPIIIAYINNRKKEGIIISLFYIFIAVYKYGLDFKILLLEYTIYYVMSFKLKEYNNILYIIISYLIKLIELIFFENIYYHDNIVFVILLTSLATYVVIKVTKKGESIIKYHLSYKELMREKQIQTSLFKITHEIKNPLAVCKGYFQMLNFDDMDRTKKYINVIREEVNHALLIIGDFSDLSKVNVEKTNINLDSVISMTLENLSELFKYKKISVNYSKNNIDLCADSKRIMQVLVNLLKNSVEAMDDSISKVINIKTKVLKNNVYIEIEDTGCGMDKELLKNFEQAFYTTKSNGTGLGTVITNEIVKAHHGSIKYFSKLNKGTKVIITLQKNY